MKKVFLVWFAVLFTGLILSCSVAPEIKQFLGDWWLSSIDTEVTDMSGDSLTNWSDTYSKSETFIEMTFTETNVIVVDSSSGSNETETSTYTVDGEAKTITMTMDGEERTLNYQFNDAGTEFTALEAMTITNGMGSSSNIMIMDMTFTKDES